MIFRAIASDRKLTKRHAKRCPNNTAIETVVAVAVMMNTVAYSAVHASAAVAAAAGGNTRTGIGTAAWRSTYSARTQNSFQTAAAAAVITAAAVTAAAAAVAAVVAVVFDVVAVSVDVVTAVAAAAVAAVAVTTAVAAAAAAGPACIPDSDPPPCPRDRPC